ncbi:MAG: deoxyguanosinetriphosphate triphosphohydrolase, partial [Actinobacteria bacterium]|nr:deoxyguanosinetriphosphate triphosphohydrolase [Actinomycetota bacterium]
SSSTEKSAFERIKDATGIGAHRHPLALLLEAIDDIAYSAADIEDGFKKGVLTFDIIKGVLGQKLDFSVEEENLLFKKIDEYLNEVHPDYPEKQAIAVQRFRIKAQGVMIESVVKAFMDNLEQIFTGNFDEELLLVSKAKNLRLAFKFLAEEYVFKDKSIILKELVGEKVISCLLSSFVEAVTADDRLKGSTKVGKLYYLVSPNYKFIMDNFPSELDDERKPSLYDRLLLATDFICGMTDSYALELYHNLSGIKL